MKFRITFLCLLLSLSSFSQTNDSIFIEGQVVSKNNNPIPGVIIRVYDTKIGTVTDNCGLFKISAPIEGVLEFAPLSIRLYKSILSLDIIEKNEFLKIELDLDENEKNCKAFKKGKKIKISQNQGVFAHMILAAYNRNIKKITRNHIEKHTKLNRDINFLLNGDLMNSDFSFDKINFEKIKEVLILRNIDNFDTIIIALTIK